MRKLVICSKYFLGYYDQILASGNFSIDNELIHYALINTDDIKFDPAEKADSVLVRKKAFSCNYREQSLIKAAALKIKSDPDSVVYYTIGSEFAGIVEAVGANVKELRPGDRVIGNASYPDPPALNVPPGIPSNHSSGELEIFNKHKLIKIPDSMSNTAAAGFGIGAQTAYAIIEKIGLEKNKRILITGINSNTSLFILNAVRHTTTKIVGLSRNEVDPHYFATMGLEKNFVIDDSLELFQMNPELMNYIRENGLFDYIFDPFSDKNLLRSIDLLAVKGKYITCGISNQFNREVVEVSINLVLSKIIQNNLSILGNCLGTTFNLEQALKDFDEHRFSVIPYQVFQEDIASFITDSFVSKKLGKAIYEYV